MCIDEGGRRPGITRRGYARGDLAFEAIGGPGPFVKREQGPAPETFPSKAGGDPRPRPTKLPASAPFRPESHGGAGPSVVNQSATRSRSWALSSRPTSLVLQLPKTL